MSVKDRETLVFVLEKGARIPSKISTDLEPPDEWWVTKAVKSISNHALQATQPSQPTPPSPTRSPQRKKKKREIADKGTKEETEEELRLRQCMSGINEMSEKDKSSARAVLKGVTNMMNGSKPDGSNRMGMERTKKYMAATLFSVLLAQMDSDILFSSMAHLLASSQEVGKESVGAAAKQRTSVVTPPAPAAIDALLAPVIDSTLPAPDEMAHAIIRSVKSDIESNSGKAIKLSMPLNRLFGVLAVAQSKDFLNDPKVPPVITAYKAHDNNWPVKVIVLPHGSISISPWRLAGRPIDLSKPMCRCSGVLYLPTSNF